MGDFLNPAIIWFIIGVIFLFLEFALPGVIIGFFGVGAILTAVLALTGVLNSLISQLIFFCVSSILLLVFLRRMLKEHFMGKTVPKDNGADEFIGRKAVVIKRIIPNSTGGRVKYEGTEWNAIADVEIEVGKFVTIVSKENITLKVEES